MYHSVYRLAMLLNLYSTSDCFYPNQNQATSFCHTNILLLELPSAYEKCCIVVKEITVKGCVWIYLRSPCWWQTVGTVFPSAVCLPHTSQKNPETEFWENREAFERQMSAKLLLFELLKEALWGMALQEHCTEKQVGNLGKSEARGKVVKGT